jgi:hypothetical protein
VQVEGAGLYRKPVRSIKGFICVYVNHIFERPSRNVAQCLIRVRFSQQEHRDFPSPIQRAVLSNHPIHFLPSPEVGVIVLRVVAQVGVRYFIEIKHCRMIDVNRPYTTYTSALHSTSAEQLFDIPPNPELLRRLTLFP